MRFLKIILPVFLTGILFFGCKKYPENKLWFKKPESVFKGGKITSYTINGIDKMEYFRSLYRWFPYNFYGQKIEDVFDLPFSYNPANEDFYTDYGTGSLHFSKTKREIEITFEPVNESYGAENIFVGRLSWKVMKLTKDGVLKIQAKYNFKLYEMQFN